jgi:hypothetical protein
MFIWIRNKLSNAHTSLSSRPRANQEMNEKVCVVIALFERRPLTYYKKTLPKQWKAPSLRAPFLISIILASAGLIITLQLLLMRSNRDGGVIFAPNINDLPLSSSIPYLYLPTIISVLFGFLWTWIDLDIRRLEPYYQLSRENGALGKESILLQYPVDFLASVPIKAVRLRWATTICVLGFMLISLAGTGQCSQHRLLLCSSFGV